jgi:hypothetical protein
MLGILWNCPAIAGIRAARKNSLTGRRHMALKERSITIPEIILIAGTRVALGVGIGLLIADRLNKDQRKGAGWALFGVGVLTTIPLARAVLGKPSVGK